MVLIPTIESYFVTVKVRAELIGGILTEVINILVFPKYFIKDIAEKKYQYLNVNDNARIFTINTFC